MLKQAQIEANAKPKDSVVVNGTSPSYKPFEYPANEEYGVDRNEDVAYGELAKIRKMLGMPPKDDS